MADLVWSDPDPDKEEFAISPRGAGYTFGSTIVSHFLERNGMNHILRAHQLCMECVQRRVVSSGAHALTSTYSLLCVRAEASRSCTTTSSARCGVRQTTAIDAATWLQSLRLGRAGQSISIPSWRRRRTREMDRCRRQRRSTMRWSISCDCEEKKGDAAVLLPRVLLDRSYS